MLDKYISFLNLSNTICKKSYVKASTHKILGKSLPGDKTCGIDPDIHLYGIEDGDETEKGEESEILVFYDSSLAASKQNLVNRQFPYINTVNHEGPVVINAMHDLTV